nr:hypothetical protein [uncultured Vibrio sp.]
MSMKTGEITGFDVVAKCPYCEDETSVTEGEAKHGVVECQHCEEYFTISFDR